MRAPSDKSNGIDATSIDSQKWVNRRRALAIGGIPRKWVGRGA
jgi:hypothetical protein